MVVVSLRRLLVAGAAVLAAGVTAVPAQAASPSPAPAFKSAHAVKLAKPGGTSTAHPVRPAGFKGGAASAKGAASRAANAALTRGVGNLLYNEGAVQTAPRIFLDFWGTDWTTPGATDGTVTLAAAQTYVTTFVNDLAGSTYLSSQTQYCERDQTPIALHSDISACANNSHAGVPGALAGVWNDPGAVAPSTSSTAADISNEADAARAHFGVAEELPTSPNSLFIVLAPAGKSNFNVPGIGSACGYHDWDLDSAGNLDTVFSYIAWAPDNAGCETNAVNSGSDAFGHGHLDGLSIVTGHEIAETITDPTVGACVNNPQTGTCDPFFGWVDSATPSSFETGDKCQVLATWPAHDLTLADNFFAVQPLWSNAGSTCPLEDIGGLSTAHAAIAAQDATHRDAFVRGVDGAVWWRSSAGSVWSSWTSLGGFTSAGPGAVSWSAGRIDMFVVGSDSALWHKAWVGGTGWSGWQSLGGIIKSSPGVASLQTNNLDVVAVGIDNALWHRQWNGAAWSDWESLGGVITADPGTVAPSSTRLDVFGRGLDNAMWHRTRTGTTWGAWESLGGGFASGETAALTSTAQPEVFAVGLDGAIWRDSFNGSAFTGWSSLEGRWTMAPAAVTAPGTTTPELFNVGSTFSTERLLLGT